MTKKDHSRGEWRSLPADVVIVGIVNIAVGAALIAAVVFGWI